MMITGLLRYLNKSPGTLTVFGLASSFLMFSFMRMLWQLDANASSSGWQAMAPWLETLLCFLGLLSSMISTAFCLFLFVSKRFDRRQASILDFGNELSASALISGSISCLALAAIIYLDGTTVLSMITTLSADASNTFRHQPLIGAPIKPPICASVEAY